jgi:plastocyanin domain-containing protein
MTAKRGTQRWKVLQLEIDEVRKFLPSNQPAVISFTPQAVGDIGFNCAMGMMSWGSRITVIPNPSRKPTALSTDVQQTRLSLSAARGRS